MNGASPTQTGHEPCTKHGNKCLTFIYGVIDHHTINYAVDY